MAERSIEARKTKTLATSLEENASRQEGKLWLGTSCPIMSLILQGSRNERITRQGVAGEVRSECKMVV